MRYSFLFLVVACTAGLALSKPLQSRKLEGSDQPKRIDFKKSDLYKQLHTLADTQNDCLDVYYEYTNSPHFLECINYEDFLYDLDYPELFCEDDCVNYLDQAVAAITRACGFPPFQTLSDQFCDRSDTSHEYCDELWAETTTNVTFNTLYNDCSSTSSQVQTCPDSCEEVINYISTRLGCCYNYLAETEGEYELPDHVLDICNFRVPSACPSPRPERLL